MAKRDSPKGKVIGGKLTGRKNEGCSARKGCEGCVTGVVPLAVKVGMRSHLVRVATSPGDEHHLGSTYPPFPSSHSLCALSTRVRNLSSDLLCTYSCVSALTEGRRAHAHAVPEVTRRPGRERREAARQAREERALNRPRANYIEFASGAHRVAVPRTPAAHAHNQPLRRFRAMGMPI